MGFDGQPALASCCLHSMSNGFGGIIPNKLDRQLCSHGELIHAKRPAFRDSKYFFTGGGPPSVDRRIRLYPKTVANRGMSSVTTAFAPITLQAPMVTGP